MDGFYLLSYVTSCTSVLRLIKSSHTALREQELKINVTFQTKSRKLEHLYSYAINQCIPTTDISLSKSYNAAWCLT